MKLKLVNDLWYRPLRPEERITEGDWVVDVYCNNGPMFRRVGASVGTLTSAWSGWVFYREIDPLIAAMIKVKEEKK